MTRSEREAHPSAASVWSGNVYEFELLDHPSATTCYAWETGGTITAVLHSGPVDSALKAVRASILAEGTD